MSGALLSPPDERDYPVSAAVDVLGVDIPADFEVWQPPVENQGRTGNCVAQSLANIMECIWVQKQLLQQYGIDLVSMSVEEYLLFIQDNAELISKLHEDYSVGYIYGSLLNSVSKYGMIPREACSILLKEGDVLRAVWESLAENPQCRNNRSKVGEDITSQAHKIAAYIRIYILVELKAFMIKYKLPVMLIAPTSAFAEGGEGNHATVCYGWNEDGLKFTNHWGLVYHDQGRGVCRYDDMEEIWGIVPNKQGEDIMRGIELLHPDLQNIAAQFVEQCKAAGLNVKITDTLRTKAEQDALYAQGRTAPGSIVTNVAYPNSAHNWGVAFDICRNEKGREYDDSDGFFAKCGEVGKKLGLFWGGDFRSFTDKPHFEMPEFMPDNSTKWLKVNYGMPENFIKSWEEYTMTAEKLAELLPEAFKILANKPESSWAKPALEWAKQNGIMQGDGTGNLMPQKPMTREELAQVLFNMKGGAKDD